MGRVGVGGRGLPSPPWTFIGGTVSRLFSAVFRENNVIILNSEYLPRPPSHVVAKEWFSDVSCRFPTLHRLPPFRSFETLVVSLGS